MNTIIWTKRAHKQLGPIPTKDVESIIAAVETLTAWPEVKNVKTLAGRDGYRLRVGRYRVFFSVAPNGEVTIILIEEVKKRDERTY